MKNAKWKEIVTPELCRKLLTYDPHNGVLTWKPRDIEFFNGDKRSWKIWNTRFSGKAIPSNPVSRKRSATCQNTTVLGHRIDQAVLAWMIFYGETPSGYMGRIDGDHMNYRIDNLYDNKRAAAPEGYFDE